MNTIKYDCMVTEEIKSLDCCQGDRDNCVAIKEFCTECFKYTIKEGKIILIRRMKVK
jgi:hypothetical protein